MLSSESLAVLSASFPGCHLAIRHSELTCDKIDPLDEARRLDWDLREEGVPLELAVLGAPSPMLDGVEIPQDHIDLVASAPEPGTPVHHESPRSGRKHGAAGCEGG